MKFYVVLSDGRKFGPADIATLNQWITEGRLNRDTMLENEENGQQARARDVQGLQWANAAPSVGLGGEDPVLKAGEAPLKQQSTGPSIPGQPVSYVAGRPEDTAQQNPYANPPQPASPYQRTYDRHLDDGSQKLVNTAWILIAVGFACCVICTPFGIYNANRAKLMGNPNAATPFLVGWIVFGLQLLGILIYGIVVVLAITSGGTIPGQ